MNRTKVTRRIDNIIEGKGIRGPKPAGWKIRFAKIIDRIRLGVEECLIWDETLNDTGYGCMSIANKVYLAHRLSWWYFIGPFDLSKFILHRCDNPACVNPNHLFIGTARDNTQDAINKGRALIGEKNGQSKLQLDQVIEIFDMRHSGMKLSQIARIYSVHPPAISRILNGHRGSKALSFNLSSTKSRDS